MANPPKQKGTGAETELLRLLEDRGIDNLRRTPASESFDIERVGNMPFPVNALATRPDRGRWLVSLTLDDFAEMFNALDQDTQDEMNARLGLRVEVKRYRRFALHNIYERKFPRG